MRITLAQIRLLSGPLAWALASLLVVLPLGSHAAGAVLCIKSDGDVSVRDAHSGGAVVGEHADAHHIFPTIEKPDHGSTHPTGCIDVLVPPGGDGDCASVQPDVQPDVKPFAIVVEMLESDASHLVRAAAENSAADEHLQFQSLAPVRSTQLLI